MDAVLQRAARTAASALRGDTGAAFQAKSAARFATVQLFL